jgi:hypothetical protein
MCTNYTLISKYKSRWMQAATHLLFTSFKNENILHFHHNVSNNRIVFQPIH